MQRTIARFGVIRNKNDSNVLGASVPTFGGFPHRAQDTLQLYKDFWKLILCYPENERSDLIFRLRNEFRNKRYLGNPKMMANALRRGESLLEMYRSRLEYSESKAGWAKGGTKGARSVDDVWDRIQHTTKFTIPGLANYTHSKPVGSYHTSAGTMRR
jgi:hypothetical protein